MCENKHFNNTDFISTKVFDDIVVDVVVVIAVTIYQTQRAKDSKKFHVYWSSQKLAILHILHVLETRHQKYKKNLAHRCKLVQFKHLFSKNEIDNGM